MHKTQTYALQLPTRACKVVVDETAVSVTLTLRYVEDEKSDPEEKEGFMKWVLPVFEKHFRAEKQMIFSVPQRGIKMTFDPT